MRSLQVSWVLSVVVAAVGLSGCAAPTEEDTGDQTSNVTGGSGSVESPVVYLFETDRATAPTCAGAMLADKVAVTLKSCAKVGLILGRAADRNGRGQRVRVTAVHTPDDPDADIAVVELDKAVGGTHARITHMPLRDGYSVNGIADKDGSIPIISPDKGDASAVKGSILEETASHGSITPKAGSEICGGDLGAPVCSSDGLKVFGRTIHGTCGLSGLVVGPMQVNPTLDGATPAPAACSNKAWKVTQLGRHAEFLRQYAPTAFQPMRIDLPLIRNYAIVPEGLWGYQTKGEVKTCKIETPSLTAVSPSTASQKITAKVTFAGMEKRAAAWGRFGIAPKSAPTQMRWLPARGMATANGAALDATFEGIVSADTIGDYIVAFRASANGGESWTSCDTDGIENGFQIEKGLALQVVDAASPPGGANPPSGTEPQSEPPGNQEPPYSDPAPSSDDGMSTEPGEDGPFVEEDEPVAKKKSDSGGCSMSSSGGATSSLPLAGVLLGLATLARRRRSR